MEETDELDEQKKDKKFVVATSGCLGCLGSAIVGWGFIIIGGLISLTGVGAIIGVPMIILGILGLCASPLMALICGTTMAVGTIQGKCPYCGADVGAMKLDKGTNCPACDRRIIIKDKQFYKVE